MSLPHLPACCPGPGWEAEQGGVEDVETQGVGHLHHHLVGEDEEVVQEDNDKSDDKQADSHTQTKQVQEDIRDPNDGQ